MDELEYSNILSKLKGIFPEYGAFIGMENDGEICIAFHHRDDKDNNVLVTVTKITAKEVIDKFI